MVDFKDQYLNESNLSYLDDCDVIIDCTGSNDVVDLFAMHEFKDIKDIYIGAFNYGATGFAFYKQKSNKINIELY